MHLALELSRGDRAATGSPEPLPRPDFDSYVRLAQTAERGLFDFLLLADHPVRAGDRTNGQATATDCLEPVTVLTALAGVTERIGLAAAPVPADREPAGLARRFAALDQLSGGRAGGPGAAVTGYPAPRGPQGRPVVIQDGDDGAAEVVLLDADGVRGTVRPGVRVLVRIDWSLAEADAEPAHPGPAASAEEGAEQLAGAGTFTNAAHVLAARLDGLVQSGAVDGFLLPPGPEPGGHGLDAFVDQVVPLLQQRGCLRTAYQGTTLREHLGLPRPVWRA